MRIHPAQRCALEQGQGGSLTLRISKSGERYLRRLLVSAAQYILGPFGQPSALREFGLKLAEPGTARAKKRDVVAVARKLSVLLLSLWKNRVFYEPMPEAECEPV